MSRGRQTRQRWRRKGYVFLFRLKRFYSAFLYFSTYYPTTFFLPTLYLFIRLLFIRPHIRHRC
ncbi:hypothetical protein B484DRAFT_452676 [Ochromonadaceae sp. CCMP2298]|nr:hypothetical protein B484DRAFT_452676 [Ochromonadaceae sp. CCMP2298]